MPKLAAAVATALFALSAPAIAQDPKKEEKKAWALIEQGYEPVGSTPAELAAAQAADLKRWEGPIKATGVQLD